jgi:hypothetical protein
MKTWTDTTYYPDAREDLLTVTHPEAVSIVLGGCLASNGQGFSVRVETAHLDALRKAVAHLEHVAAQQAQAADDDPFPEADALYLAQLAAADADAERYADDAPTVVEHDVF